jgi:hypothetical protein
MHVEALEQIVRSTEDPALAPTGRVQAGRRLRDEVRRSLDDDRLDVLVDRERKVQRARQAFDVALVERGEVLGDQAEALQHRRREADRKARIELTAGAHAIGLRKLRRPGAGLRPRLHGHVARAQSADAAGGAGRAERAQKVSALQAVPSSMLGR